MVTNDIAQGLIRLPAEVTGFVGRDRELAELTATLERARLVTVTGPGGVGKTRVALREREIATLVAQGLSNREIAQRLVISKRTVDAHIEHIFGKLGISTRVQLATWLSPDGGPTRI